MDIYADTVYQWEETLPGYKKTLTVEKARLLIQSAHRHFGIYNYPQLKITNGINSSYYDHTRKLIVILPCMLTKQIVLHEAAHSITYHFFGSCMRNPHGPTYLSVYMILLNRFMKVSIPQMKKSLKQMGIQDIPIERVGRFTTNRVLTSYT